MRTIILSIIMILCASIFPVAEAQNFPPSKFPSPVKVMTDAGVAQYWNVKRIMCIGKSGSGYKFRIFGQAEATTGSQSIGMYYILPGNKLQSAGAYRFPAITKGEPFQFEITSAFQGYAPATFLGFMIMDENLKAPEPEVEKSAPAEAIPTFATPELTVSRDEEIVAEVDDNEIYEKVETEPAFPGGLAGIMTHIGKKMHYPPMAAEGNIQGRVIVGIVIEKDGSVSNVTLVKGVHSALDKEALRVVGTLPKFSSPGKINGRPKRTRMNIPVTFKLN